ncbi:hypothetical protein CN556_06455 [Bacillus wiedmannii]|nr:hypothetical protein CON91_23810 [Bacillus wiedmannii]PEI31112.1 hypothetical protein CN644_30430 [Bacillus wiedmannii]PEN97937.1 hypothetical protein CN556_06455 [Bacillus wiedmannii]
MSFSLLLKVHPLIVIYYILFILFLQVFKNDFLLNKKKKPKIDFWFPLLNFTNLVVRNLSLKIDVVSLSSINLSTVQQVNYLILYS